MQWQDIALAPKDGTKADLWVVENGIGCRWGDCWWSEQYKCWIFANNMIIEPENGKATHFMIVEPPK